MLISFISQDGLLHPQNVENTSSIHNLLPDSDWFFKYLMSYLAIFQSHKDGNLEWMSCAGVLQDAFQLLISSSDASQ